MQKKSLPSRQWYPLNSKSQKKLFFFSFQWGGGVEVFEIQAKGLLHISSKEWNL